MIRHALSLALLVGVLAAAGHTAPPPPQQKPPVKGRKLALLVGVGTFRQPFTDLKGMPQRDVAALAKELRDGGFEVVTLTDEQATKDRVEAEYRKLLFGDGKPLNAVAKGDVVLFAMCTHGFTIEVADPETKKKAAKPFLAAWESIPGNADTMLSLTQLMETGQPLGATKLFLVDACREVSDPDRGRGFDPSRVSPPERTCVLFSCARGQFSHQSEKLGGGHGLFTYAVLKVLRGETGVKSEVSWNELVSHVGKVFRSAEYVNDQILKGREQTPLSAQGETVDVVLVEVHTAARPAPTELAPALPQGRRVALLIGISDYKDTGLASLGGVPENDVAELGKVLEAGGYSVTRLTNKEATKGGIERAFDALVRGPGAVKKNDTLLVAFGGQGMQHSPEDEKKGKPKQPFLVAADSKRDETGTMVGLNPLIAAASESGASCLFLLDTSRAPYERSKGRGADHPDGVELRPGVAILFSCSRGEDSFQRTEPVKHGVFTYAVLKALRGETGLTGEISWSDLVAGVEKAFATDEFIKKGIAAGRTQRPVEVKVGLPYVRLLDRPVGNLRLKK